MTDCFVFDLFENKKQNILKVGYRFKFQSQDRNLKDEDVEKIITKIINEALAVEGVSIEGL